MRGAAEVGKAATPEIESPEKFLTQLGERLLAEADVDVDLAGILAAHVLTAAPSGDAVSKAKAAILTLASERAAPPKKDSANG